MADGKPFPKHTASTVFLRVPSGEWQAVSRGRQHEFRAALGNVPQLFHVPKPTLAVCYRKRRAAGDYDHRLMVLEDARMEMLGAVTDEGLRLAGYNLRDAEGAFDRDGAFARFRRDWMNRERKRFTPTRKVMVFRVRPIDHARGDLDIVGRSLVQYLYSEYLDAPTEQQGSPNGERRVVTA